MILTKPLCISFKNAVIFRYLFFILFLILEICLLTISFDTQSFEKIDLPLLNFLGYSGEILRFSIGVIGAFIVFSSARLKLIFLLFNKNEEHSSWKFWFLSHLFFISGLYSLSYQIFEVIPQLDLADIFRVNITVIAWLLTGLFSIVCWLLSIAPQSNWLCFVKQEKNTITLSIVIGIIVWQLGNVSEMAWQPFADLTFWSVYYLLLPVYSDVVFDVSTKLLGTYDFKVIISSQCSGYEGIGLVTVFLAVYLWVARKNLRFPQAYLLFPMGIMTIWGLNVFRIALLIIIGSSGYPEIAVGGFHSNAGWIAFVFTSVCLVLLCQHIPFFNKQFSDEIQPALASATGATHLLLPFVVMLASLLLTSVFVIDFDWLYPLRAIVMAGVLWYFRDLYYPYIKNISIYSVFLGLLVFIIWLILVPDSDVENTIFADALFNVSPYLTFSWLFFRIIGASILVPIAEELVFRGYLIAKLVNTRFETVKAGHFTWFSFFGSSVLFGIMHGEWLAGIIAGLFFALALYKRGALFDAVVAHMTANILLACYILLTQNWSLW